MPIALVISELRDATEVLPWTIQLARARNEPLLIIHLVCQGNQKKRQIVSPSADDDWGKYTDAVAQLRAAGMPWREGSPQDLANDAAEAPGYRIVRRVHGQPAGALCEEIAKSRVTSLVLRRDASAHAEVLDPRIVQELLNNAFCEVIQLHPGAKGLSDCHSIAVPMGAAPHSESALVLAQELSQDREIAVTAIYVEPDVDVYAQQVGHRILDRQVERALGGHAAAVERRVVLDHKVHRGIRSVVADYDTIVLGTRHRGRMRRLLIGTLSEDLLSMAEGPTVIAVRPPTPFSGRVVRAVDRLLRNGIPQLERSERIAVVERIQSSSNWDFDFIALVCLSTLIAAGGLIQDSAAVVIGAMLVAPLMTPLLGAGLSLVQGNLILLSNTAQSVLRGFLLAVSLSFIAGWCCPGLSVTNEMAVRGAPSILDLCVAFISGVAAAYAIGRRNLLSALPGVAIAAALVPPIATVGLSLSIGEFHIAAGAALLFLTNIVAIVLGTACSFLAVGVRGSHSHGAFQSRSLRIAVGLILLFLGLGVYESIPKHRISQATRAGVEQSLDSEDRLVSIRWITGTNRLRVVVESQQPLEEKVTRDISRRLTRETGEAVQVEIESRLVTIVGP